MARLPGIVFVLFASVILIGGVEAQDTKRPKLDVEAVFKKLDANKDNKLAKEEFLRLADRFKDKEKARAKLTRTYDSIDPTNAGLSKTQFSKYLDEMKKKVPAKNDSPR